MLLRTKLHGKTYEFPDIRILMGKANEQKSGDQLAGVGAETTAERVAARLVLAEVPLWVLRQNPAVPYDQDEITRVIQDGVDESVYNGIKDKTVGEFREWLLADTTSTELIRRASDGLTAEMIAAVAKLMSNLDLMYAAKKMPVSAYCNNTIGAPGTLSSRNQPNHPTDSPAGIRAEIYEGLSYGSGDSVIGIKPPLAATISWACQWAMTPCCRTSLPLTTTPPPCANSSTCARPRNLKNGWSTWA
jgi:ethanolamine ammonia-lyase large subunit